jgi:hypothetical protein
MRSLFFLILSFFLSITLSAQAKKSTFKVEREKSNNVINNQAKLIVKFVGPGKQPVKSRVTMLVNQEEAFAPEINEKGVFKTDIEAGVHSFKFMVPYWYDAVIDKLKFNKNEIVSITIYFNAKDI